MCAFYLFLHASICLLATAPPFDFHSSYIMEVEAGETILSCVNLEELL